MCESESESHECNNGKMGISIKFVELVILFILPFFSLTQFYNQQFLFPIVMLLLVLHYTEHSSSLCYSFLAILSAIILDTISSMSMYNLPFLFGLYSWQKKRQQNEKSCGYCLNFFYTQSCLVRNFYSNITTRILTLNF